MRIPTESIEGPQSKLQLLTSQKQASNRSSKAADFSRQVALALLSKSRIIVGSGQDLEILLQQARANKALARVIPLVDVYGDANRKRLDAARSEAEQRLRDALELLSATQRVCLEMKVPFAVIKSLDALPDMGHDVDLLVGKNIKRVRAKILERFKCRIVTLTFCDRQAGKFSTFIEGFDADFELYTRFSQLGEEYYPEEDVLKRRFWSSQINGGTYLCSVEDRLLISCIHTLYRHGKIRLSDLNIVYEAYKSDIDVEYVLQTIEASGAKKGFVVFMRILERMSLDAVGRGVLPVRIKEYVDRVLSSDRVLRILVNRLKLNFPLRMPVSMLILLFLYKAVADLTRSHTRSSLRAMMAPILLILDKVIPLRLQKAISVRIW